MPLRKIPPLLWIITGVALVIRLAYLVQYSHTPFFQVPQWDAEEYCRIASELAHGRLDPAWSFRAPLYPLFLAIIYILFGEHLLWPRLIQIGLGIANVLLINRIAEKLYGRTGGLIAGFIAAGAGMMFYYDLELLPTALEVFFILMALKCVLFIRMDGNGQDRQDGQDRQLFFPLLLLKGGIKPFHFLHLLLKGGNKSYHSPPLPLKGGIKGGLPFLRAGLWIGLAALTRPTALVILPVLIVYLMLQRRGQLSIAVWSMVGAIIPLGMSLGLHLAAGAGPVIISTQGGVNFYVGNQRHADGFTAQLPGVGAGWSWETLNRIVEERTGSRPTPGEVDRYFWKEGFNEITAAPTQWLKLMCRKTRLFWNHMEISSNRDLYYHAHINSIFRWGMKLGFSLLLPLGLAGLFLTWTKPPTRLLAAMILALFAATMFFFVNARFRHPVLALLIILVGGGLGEAVRVWSEHNGKKLLAAGIGLVLGIILLFSARSGIDTKRWDYGLFSEGQANERLGNLKAAERNYTSALAANPHAPYVNFHLAELYLNSGNWPKAIRFYRNELEIQPRFAAAWCNLGAALIETGDSSGAVHAYQAALAIQPGLGEAQRNLQRLTNRKP